MTLEAPPRITLRLETLSPVAHGDTLSTQGNTTLFMRQLEVIDGVPVRMPCLSANALRSVMLRTPLADRLLQQLEIPVGGLSQSAVNLLYAGGSLKQGSKAPAAENEYAQQIFDLYPNFRLLGGSVDAFLLPRSDLKVLALVVCRENQEKLGLLAPELEVPDISIWDLVQDEVRTRGTGDVASGNQMLFQYETLAAGTQIWVELLFDRWSTPAVVAAGRAALQAWDQYIGARASQGRGRVHWQQLEGPTDIGPWQDHLATHHAAMQQGLLDGTLGTDRVQLS